MPRSESVLSSVSLNVHAGIDAQWSSEAGPRRGAWSSTRGVGIPTDLPANGGLYLPYAIRTMR